MPKYHIQHTQEFEGVSNVIFYQGNNHWTTVHEHRKIYDKKADATKELYDFGGTVVKDVEYNPNAVDGKPKAATPPPCDCSSTKQAGKSEKKSFSEIFDEMLSCGKMKDEEYMSTPRFKK